VTWKPAIYQLIKAPHTFMLKCPYCFDEWGIFDRDRDGTMPLEITCSECDRTFIVPVRVSRGNQ
jgi:hypothetical protein